MGITAYVGYRNLKNGEETLKVGQKNLKVAEDKQVTERFSKSIEHLGSDKIDIRLGGIYALEQIAFDSAKYHWTSVEILSAFIREKRPLNSTDPVGIDVRAALIVIGRRNVTEDPSNNSINLKSVNLGDVEVLCAKLIDTDLSDTDLSHANLCQADLINTDLSNVDLSRTLLLGADLSTSKNLTNDRLKVAITNEHTKLPDYLNMPISRSI